MTPDTSAEAVFSEKWAIAMRRLPSDEQSEMLLAAQTLLRHADAVSTPLETELHVLTEQLRAARPGWTLAPSADVSE